MLAHVRAFSEADVQPPEPPQAAGKLKVIGMCLTKECRSQTWDIAITGVTEVVMVWCIMPTKYVISFAFVYYNMY